MISLCCAVVSCGGVRNVRTTVGGNDSQKITAAVPSVWAAGIYVPGEINRYRVNIDMGKAWLSGIMLVRESDGVRKGTVMNEFGIKAFDFEVSVSDASMTNAMPVLNKFYIRKEIARDLQFMLMIDELSTRNGMSINIFPDSPYDVLTLEDGKRRLVRWSDGSITMYNLRRRIEYSLEKND